MRVLAAKAVCGRDDPGMLRFGSGEEAQSRHILHTSSHLVADPTPNENSRSAPTLSDAMISGFPLSSCHPMPVSPSGYTCTRPPSSGPAPDSIRSRMESISGVHARDFFAVRL